MTLQQWSAFDTITFSGRDFDIVKVNGDLNIIQ